MATDRFYGDNLNLNLPFTFDKTYPNFYSAMMDIDNIFLGRYIFIRYSDDEDIDLPEGFFTEDQLSKYYDFVSESSPHNKNWFIDKVYIDNTVDYHLTAWKKTVINGSEYGYEMVGNFDVTLPSIQIGIDYKSPAEVERIVSEGKHDESITVKGDQKREYLVTVPSARAWQIELDRDGPNLNEDGFDKQTNYYDEQATENFIRFVPEPAEDAEEEEKTNYQEDFNAGIKRLQVELPIIGNTVAKTYDVIYGSSSPGTARPYYDLLMDSSEEYGTVGGCISSFQKMFGKNNLINYTSGLPSTGSTLNIGGAMYPVLNENTIKEQAVIDFADRPDISFIIYHFGEKMGQTQSGVNVSGSICYVNKKNVYVSTTNDIDKVLLISSDTHVVDSDWWFKLDSYIDLILQGQAISNGAAVAAEKLEEYGEKIQEQATDMETLGTTLDGYKNDLVQAKISFPGQTAAAGGKPGSEVFNLEVKDLGEGNYERVSHNSVSEVKYASAHGYGTTAHADYQTVVGCYNKTDVPDGHNPLFVVGCGAGASKKQNVLSAGWTTVGTTRTGNVLVDGQFKATNLLMGDRMSISGSKIKTSGNITLEPSSTTTIKFDKKNPFNFGHKDYPLNNIYTKTLHTTTGDSYLQGPVRINGGADTEVGDTKSGMLILGSASGNRMCLDENEIGAFTFNDKKQYVTRDLVIHATSLWAKEGTDLGENGHPWNNIYCTYFRTLTDDKTKKKYLLPKEQGTIYLGSTTYRWNTVASVNGITTTSDIRLKNVDNSGKLNLMLKTYDLLDPIAYTWKNQEEDKKLHIGLSAQQVEEKLAESGLKPEEVHLLSKEDDEYSLNYGELHGLHILKNKEQDQKIKELEDKIKVLEEKLDKLLS